MDTYQKVIHQSRYARWDETTGRRESWEETVSRYCDNWTDLLSSDEAEEIKDYILDMKVMPSMRAMWASGSALSKNSITGYNCSYVTVNTPRAFDEALYILACGTGVGFGVEAKDTNKLPIVNDHIEDTERTIKIEDSKEGWAKALRKCIADGYLGRFHKYDYSMIRPAGARLKTMGGRASGPEPLKNLLEFVHVVFKGAAGRKLTPLECHDIMCKVGEIVVVGGVRRSAMISLSDLGDTTMANAKSGTWWDNHGHRALANNSAVYESKPDDLTFLKEWEALVRSQSGERGIYSRSGAQKLAPERRKSELIEGTNPCAEIALRSSQFCNLTEVVARHDDTIDTLKEKIRVATILGTLQSTLTNFPYLREIWKTNTEEERLLGVSLTGIQDCPVLRNAEGSTLEDLKNVSINTNMEWSTRLGIPTSAAITTIKPSGTVSQLVNSSSGIHGRFAPHYIRTVRQSMGDPLSDFLMDQGVPVEPCAMAPNQTLVFSFPIASPDGAVLATDQTAIEQLEMWKKFKTHWAEHSVSVTVYVKSGEWMKVGAWVHENFDYLTGVSFLPYSEHTYQQAPYQDITEEEYEKAFKKFPSQINWNDLTSYEQDDNTEGAQTLACTGGACEIK